jgi:hypothetical protein
MLQVKLVRRRMGQLMTQGIHLLDCGFVGQDRYSLLAIRYSRTRVSIA